MKLTEKNAFTLIEVMMTLLLSIGTMGLIQTFNNGLYSYGKSQKMNRALDIAQGKMEEVMNTAYADLIDQALTPDPYFPDFSISLDIAEGANPSPVEVQVQWTTYNGNDVIKLNALKTNYVSK